MEKAKNYKVFICEDYVIRDPDKVKGILDRVSKIIRNSYIEGGKGLENEKSRQSTGKNCA